MKKLNFNFLRDYFIFSKKEQRGLLVLAVLLFLIMIFNGILPFLYQYKPVDFSEFEAEILAFEASLTKKQAPVKNVDYKSFFESKKDSVIKKSVIEKKTIQEKEVIIELNSCDSTDLIKLKGIGPVFSSRIIKFRKILGGYYDTKQLLEVYGMDSARLIPLLPSLTVDTGLIKRMDLNSVEFKKLLKHPYFEYEIVKAIFNYKRDHRGFNHVTELQEVDGISDTMFKKMKNYLFVGKNSHPADDTQNSK